MKRVVVAVVAVQVLLVGLYLAVEASRTQPVPLRMEALDEPVAPLVVSRDGIPVAPPRQAHLVHFWATWCAPCLAELPVLLAASEASGVPLIAVTDEPWPVVRRYFSDDVPRAIVRDDSGVAAQQWGVSGLPDTYVVVEGRVVARMGGPRDWSSAQARRYLASLAR